MVWLCAVDKGAASLFFPGVLTLDYFKYDRVVWSGLAGILGVLGEVFLDGF